MLRDRSQRERGNTEDTERQGYSIKSNSGGQRELWDFEVGK